MLIPVIEEALNRALHADPGLGHALDALVGRSIAIEVVGIETRLLLAFTHQGLRIVPGAESADALVSGPPFTLLRLLLEPGRSPTLFGSDVTVRGDSQLLATVRRLLGRLDVDWEELLAARVGDPIAHLAGSLARGALRWTSAARDSLEQDVKEVLEEEVRLVARPDEVVDFVNGVDVLRDDTERLLQRVARLENKRGEGEA